MSLAIRLLAGVCGGMVALVGIDVHAQNDWQFPDPYFGAFQHRQAGTPQAEQKYRAEIAPQQPHRLHEQRVTPPQTPAKKRWFKPRSRQRASS